MGKCTEFLYLNEEDMIKAGVLDTAHCIDVEEEIFKLLSKGDYVMGGDGHNSHGIPDHFHRKVLDRRAVFSFREDHLG